jgi:hypothetical protein
VVLEVAVVGVFLQSRFSPELELLYMRLQVEIHNILASSRTSFSNKFIKHESQLQINKESTWIIPSEIGEVDSRKPIQMLSTSE